MTSPSRLPFREAESPPGPTGEEADRLAPERPGLAPAAEGTRSSSSRPGGTAAGRRSLSSLPGVTAEAAGSSFAEEL